VVSDEDIDLSQRDALLWRAVDALPERCREIFLMSKRDGMSGAEIAEELGISPKTVENQITKAYRSLRDTLNPSIHLFFFPFL
jgi:RNA polymerase sigma-70 factor (ECF subfamily)